MEESSDSEEDDDKLQGSIKSGTDKSEVSCSIKGDFGRVIVLPSVQQVGQVSNPTEPEDGCSPHFIMDRVVTGIFECSL